MTIRAICLGLGVAALSACASQPAEEEPMATAPAAPTYQSVKASVCAGDLAAAGAELDEIAALGGGVDPAHMVIAGYIDERAGRLMSARLPYRSAAASGSAAPVEIVCPPAMEAEGGEPTTLLSGPSATVAQARLATVENRLAALDVTERQIASPTVIEAAPSFPPVPEHLQPAADEPVTVIRPPAPPPMSTAWIHLVSYDREARAAEGWRIVVKQHPMLGAYKPVIKPVEIPDKGTKYRLGAIGFETADLARTVCKALAKDGQYCKVRDAE